MIPDDLNEDDRTVIRPNPGGRRPPSAEDRSQRPGRTGPAKPMRGPVPPTGDPGPVGVAATGRHAGGSPASAATAILLQGSKLRRMVTAPDIRRLQAALQEQIAGYEQHLHALNLPSDLVAYARYAVCATIDDFVLNTPWGSSSSWAAQGLVNSIHHETLSGERFYGHLAELRKNPTRNAGVLELMYLCLSLGFQGQMRLNPRGGAEIERLRNELYQQLRRDGVEPEISPHWRGRRRPPRRLGAILPAWLAPALIALALLACYFGLRQTLSGYSSATTDRLTELPRAVAFPKPPPIPPANPGVQQAPRIRKFLEPEIKADLVEVTESSDSILVRVRNRNPGLFISASADLEQEHEPTIGRIAKALDGERGAVTIIGHTDSQPIRSIRFQSNWELSVARAETVRRMIARQIADPARLSVEGRADTEPIASNDAEDGRRQNRRIDILLSKTDR